MFSSTNTQSLYTAPSNSDIKGEFSKRLFEPKVYWASFHIRTTALAIRDDGDDLYGYRLLPLMMSRAGKPKAVV